MWSNLTKFEKVNFIFTGFVKITLFIAIPFAIYERNWMTLFVIFLTLLLVLFVPDLLKKTYKVNLPAELQFIIVFFLYCSLFLGMAREWYAQLWWWDSLMHSFSGIALGFTGFLILYVLYKTERLKASPFFIVLFAFLFAVALGAIWEIFEFGVDHYFEEDMQRARYSIEEQEDGLYRLESYDLNYVFENIESHEKTRVAVYDTMWDMILNSIGALIASIAGYFYLKKVNVPILKKLVGKFEDTNPDLFKK